MWSNEGMNNTTLTFESKGSNGGVGSVRLIRHLGFVEVHFCDFDGESMMYAVVTPDTLTAASDAFGLKDDPKPGMLARLMARWSGH